MSLDLVIFGGDQAGALRPYAAGTWGPAASSALVARDGFAWPEEG